MSSISLLADINRRHSTTFTLGQRYAHGESGRGTYAVSDAAGRYGVLKVWEHAPGFVARRREIAAAITGLRDRGYPAPLDLAIGCMATACYCIQEQLPGTPLNTLTPDLVPRLVQLNALQQGQALSGPRDWPRRILDTVLHGGEGYCLLEPLCTYSAETAAVLVMLQTIVRRHAGERFETGDLVHYDFNPANLLLQNGTISGVIDWQDPCSGDRIFDLATLLLYTWEMPVVRDQLWSYCLERVGAGVLGVYLAHMILRQVDWAIRHHGAAATTTWLRIAQSALAAWAAVCPL